MKILITGGSGFVGRQLCRYWEACGHAVTAVGTRPDPEFPDGLKVRYIAADTTQEGSWQDALTDTDVVINLAGKTIAKRWSAEYKTQIRESRIRTTRHIVAALPSKKTITLCSASAVGFYGDGADARLTEDTPAGSDFLAGISREWEKEALCARDKGVRVVLTRFGVVLGKGGGALGKMLPAFRSFAGGPLGDGKQWFSWIHMYDLVAAMDFVLTHKRISGPVNFTAPNPVRQRKLAKTLGTLLNRPAIIPTPALVLRLMFGEMASVLLCSQQVVPARLQEYGFEFKYPDIHSALSDIVGKRA